MNGGGIVRRAAPEPNKRALYVGGLDQRITEEVLREIFETTGTVANVKIIPDKNVSAQETSLRFSRPLHGVSVDACVVASLDLRHVVIL